MGIGLALDDFGTGYSTLTWLQQLPVDVIKLDRSFVGGLPTDAASLAVVKGVLALAGQLDLEVIAEGVEDPVQVAVLTQVGCSLMQGFLLGRPGPEPPAVPIEVGQLFAAGRSSNLT